MDLDLELELELDLEFVGVLSPPRLHTLFDFIPDPLSLSTCDCRRLIKNFYRWPLCLILEVKVNGS